MSKLIVEVCKVDNIEKHPNADRLSIATIKGWNCIVGLNQYKPGDLVIFIPPDSIVPEDIIKKYTEGNSTIESTQIREGCVIKPLKEEYSHSIGRKILKSINPEYLCRKDRTEFH